MVRRDYSMTCRECGKDFQSWKALYGHMRCHPKPERVFNKIDNDSWVNGEKQKLLLKTQTEDVQASLPLHPKKSKKMRYSETTTTTTTSSYCSSVLQIYEEQEQAAINLMYLSRDVWNSVDPRSSHTNFVGLEVQTRSPCVGKRNPGKRNMGFDLECDQNVTLKSSKINKLESVVSETGFFRVDLKKVQSNDYVDGFLRDDELEKRKLVDRSGYIKSNKGYRKRSKLENPEAELGKESIVEARTDRAGSDFKKSNYNTNKRYWGGDASESEKRSRFECRICNKTFLSHQALGGHMSSHRNIELCISAENSTSIDDSKLYKFSSNEFQTEESQTGDMDGVAETTDDGSNKKAHSVGSSELSDQKQFLEIRVLIDLNLTPTEEETQLDYGSNHVGLISN